MQSISNWSESKHVGVMVPIPQYPLYSATNAEYALHQINYYLDESKNWALDIADMQRAIKEARTSCEPRALVCINPGNPTGQVLTRDNIVDVIRFAYDNGLLILADEVYQHNVYAEGSEFFSFKKVLTESPEPYRSGVQLASFMSISKGYMGEYVDCFASFPLVSSSFAASFSLSFSFYSAQSALLSLLENRLKTCIISELILPKGSVQWILESSCSTFLSKKRKRNKRKIGNSLFFQPNFLSLGKLRRRYFYTCLLLYLRSIISA